MIIKQVRHASALAALVGVAAIAGTGTACAALSTAPPTVTVAGVPLAGAVLKGSAFQIVVAGQGVTKAKLTVDGRYVGTDTSAPFAFAVTVASGAHKVDVRTYDSANHETRVSAIFAVSATSVTPPVSPPVSPTPPAGGAPAGAVKTVTNGAQLQAALATAAPGDRIVMADGTYVAPKGQFEASSQGTASAPITLVGSRSAVLTTGNLSGGGYGLHVTGSYWVLQGFSVTNSKKGIVLDGSAGTVIDSVDVGNIGQEGIHFRDNSVDCVLRNSLIHDTGKSSPGFGEGVYVGSANSNWAADSQGLPDRSDRVLITDNQISNTAAEGVDIKEGTSYGQLINNVFTNAGYSGANSADSWVDVKGNNYLIQGNSGTQALRDAFQVHSPLPGYGLNNRFIDNSITAGAPGYLVDVASSPSPGGNVVSCSSNAAGAAKGISNIACS